MAMQGLFREEPSEAGKIPDRSPGGLWVTSVLGFVGSAIVCWIALTLLAPLIAEAYKIGWVGNLWARIGISIVVALAMAAVLSRIEGTIWGKYYVIIGYIFSFALIVWIVLRWFHIL
jgi:hypothetical protein